MDSALYRRAAARVPEVARQMIDAFVAEVPFYAQLPREMLAGEITEIAMSNLWLFHRSLREDRAPSPDELTAQAASAARRAQERFPLDALLAVCHIGARVGLEQLAELARPEDTADLVAAAPRAMRYLQAMIAVVADAYLQEQQAIHGEDREVRRALVSSLLAGEPDALLAERLDLDLAPGYQVLALRLSDGPDDLDGGTVANRRTVRKVQRELDLGHDGHVLSALDGSGGTVLLSAPGDAPADSLGAQDGLPALVERIAAATGARVVAGVRFAETSEIPTAVAEAAEVALLAAGLGRPTGLYRLDDVLLEHQLSRPGPARDRLAGLLEPLAGLPHLLDAVRAYVECGFNRHRAAAHIHVHRNTLNYRLRRVEALTGIDPADPTGARVLSAAVITCAVSGTATQIERSDHLAGPV